MISELEGRLKHQKCQGRGKTQWIPITVAISASLCFFALSGFANDSQAKNSHTKNSHTKNSHTKNSHTKNSHTNKYKYKKRADINYDDPNLSIVAHPYVGDAASACVKQSEHSELIESCLKAEGLIDPSEIAQALYLVRVSNPNRGLATDNSLPASDVNGRFGK